MSGTPTDRDPDLVREEIRLPDGRHLVYYRFPEDEERTDDPPAEGSVGTAKGPGAAGAPPEGG